MKMIAILIHDPLDFKYILKALGKEFVFYDFSFASKRMIVFFPYRYVIYYTIVCMEEGEEAEKSVHKFLMDKLQKALGFSFRPIPATFPLEFWQHFPLGTEKNNSKKEE